MKLGVYGKFGNNATLTALKGAGVSDLRPFIRMVDFYHGEREPFDKVVVITDSKEMIEQFRRAYGEKLVAVIHPNVSTRQVEETMAQALGIPPKKPAPYRGRKQFR